MIDKIQLPVPGLHAPRIFHITPGDLAFLRRAPLNIPNFNQN